MKGFIFPIVQQSPIVLRLHKPKTDKKVQWREGTVDNEFMGRSRQNVREKAISTQVRVCVRACVFVSD